MQQIVGIGGEKEVGKDTAAQALVERHDFVRFALADPLKEMVSEAFGIPLASMHNSEEKERLFERPIVANAHHVHALIEISSRLGIPPNTAQAQGMIKTLSGKSFVNLREMLQFVGTEVMRRNVADSYWIDLFLSKIKPYPRVVVTDVRFPNERLLVKKILNGKLIRIHRPGKLGGGHASEQSLGDNKEYDLVLNNSGTIEELHAALDKGYGSWSN